MKKNLFSFLLFSILLISGKSFSQVDTNWVKRYSGTQNMDEAKAIILDASNNVYVTGKSLNAVSGYDIVTIKYSSAGAVLWTAVYNGIGNSYDEPNDLVLDGSSFYITGVTTRSVSFGLDYITIKYNASTGAIIWNSIFNGIGNGDDIATKIAVKNNRAYVTGKGFYSGASNADYVTIKYNGSTGDSIWVKNYNGTGNANDSATSLRISSDSNVFVTGKSFGTSSYDYATLRYNSTGVQNWVKRFNGPANGEDFARSISLDGTASSPDIYVTGQSTGSGTGFDIVTIKYTFASIESWNKRYNGNGNGDDTPKEITFRSSTEIYILGKASITGSGTNMLLMKLNDLGDTTWTRTHNGSANGNDEATGFTIDGSNYIYVAGQTIENAPGSDYTVIKYTTAGNIEWKYKYNYTGNGSDIPSRIIVDGTSDRNVYVTGASFSGTTGTNYATIKLKQDKVMDLTVFIQGFYRPITNSIIRDTVKVYLYNSAATDILDTAKIYIDTLGKGRLYFRKILNSTAYRIVIKHRNSIETWGNTTNTFSNLYLTYDFTTAASKAYGNNQVQVDAIPVEFANYNGDVNQDGAIDASDASIIDNDAANFVGGYVVSDVNGDNFVDGSDFLIADNNASNFVNVIRP
ncbi:MAG: hypothetical protein ABIY50_13420 [Ignavibacteria bacterium]